jgi:hypothetical protein
MAYEDEIPQRMRFSLPRLLGGLALLIYGLKPLMSGAPWREIGIQQWLVIPLGAYLAWWELVVKPRKRKRFLIRMESWADDLDLESDDFEDMTIESVEDHPPLVLLLKAPRDLSGLSWAKAVAVAAEIGAEQPVANYLRPFAAESVAAVGGQSYQLQLPEGAFAIFAVPEPFWSEAIHARILDPQLREQVGQHKAWISINLLAWMDLPMDGELINGLMSKILAVLAGDDALGVLDAGSQRVAAYSPFVQSRLELGLGRDLFDEETFGPPPQLDPTAPEMQAAIAEARSRLPEFLAHWAKRTEGSERPYLVKVPYGSEYPWLAVAEVREHALTGILLQECSAKPAGTAISADFEEIIDWVCLDDADQPLGAWTDKVLSQL